MESGGKNKSIEVNFSVLSGLVFKMHDLNIDSKVITGIIIDNISKKYLINVY